jgi:carboxylesterase type B
MKGNLTTRTGGAILLQPSTFSIAAKRCASLNEKLWSPLTSKFNAGLNDSLSYTAFINANNGKRLYWISTASEASSCNAITTNGTLTTASCKEIIPGLCTQSAPNSPANTSDTSLKFQVTVQSGDQKITGFRDFHTFQFRGIRFAQQPKRFTFSTLYSGASAVSALKYGPGCIQGPDARFPILSEDCLFLNIWTPYLPSASSVAAQRNKLKAVMFWIYGGGNTAGTGTDPEKEGVNVASRGDVVVVTFNYRLGNLGFLPFNDGVHNGNYAISDMLTALQWVNKNIEAFGGDPKRVTIWGESAGASNVAALMDTPAAHGLFRGAIMQSMPAEFGIFAGYSRWEEPKDVYETTTKKVLSESGCANTTDEVDCLRGYDAVQWWTDAKKTVQA